MIMSKCIQWHKSLNDRGYGQEFYNGKNTKAHRAEWMKANGPIPVGFVLDHKCHNEAAKAGQCAGGSTCSHRACVNLEHLQMVTQSENILSGMHSIDLKDSCPQGHSYKDERNIMVRKSGKRDCAECGRIRANVYYWAMKEKVA